MYKANSSSTRIFTIVMFRILLNSNRPEKYDVTEHIIIVSRIM